MFRIYFYHILNPRRRSVARRFAVASGKVASFAAFRLEVGMEVSSRPGVDKIGSLKEPKYFLIYSIFYLFQDGCRPTLPAKTPRSLRRAFNRGLGQVWGRFLGGCLPFRWKFV